MIPNARGFSSWLGWADQVQKILIPFMTEVRAAFFRQGGVARVRVVTVSTLPDATEGQIAYVSDESGGAVLAFSDGTNWRRVTDRSVVS